MPWKRAALLAAPGVLLGLVGAMHPPYLTYTTSEHWTIMHLVGLFVFPLVGAALMALVWGRRDPLALIVIAAAYVYATAYTALDVISGAGAGYVTYRLGPGQLRPKEVSYLFHLGGHLELVGAAGLFIAGVAVGIDAIRRFGPAAVIPALAMTAATISFFTSHIFWFRGAFTVFVIGLATGWFAWLAARATVKHGVSHRSDL